MQPSDRLSLPAAGGPARFAVHAEQLRLGPWLANLLASPDFRIERSSSGDQDESAIHHPRAVTTAWKGHVKRVDGFFVKCDQVLNGNAAQTLRTELVLKLRFVQTVLAFLGLGPVSEMAFWPATAEVSVGSRVPPLAIVGSHALPGADFEIRHDRPRFDAFIADPAAAPVLAAVWAFELDDVVKPHTGRVLNLIQNFSGRFHIIDGLGMTPPQLTEASLPRKSIRQVFGMSRAALLAAIGSAEASAQAFDLRHREAVRCFGITAGNSVPMPAGARQSLARYIERCRLRVASLHD